MLPYLVHHWLERAADHRPERGFLIHEQQHSSYGETDAGANRWARVLLAEGLQRGARVGLLAHNGRLYVEAYYGILKAGGIVVPLNTASDGRGLAQMLDDCGAGLLIAGRGFSSVLAATLASSTMLKLVFSDSPLGDEIARTLRADQRVVDIGAALASARPERPELPLSDLDVASIVYTSGSTGRPRGATLSHLNLVANTHSIVSYLELTASDRVMAILPFYYVYGKTLLNTHAAVGGQVVIENRFMFPNTALDTLERESCTGFAGVPSTFAILLNRSNFAERSLSELRYVTQAGGPMSVELTRRLIDVLPGKKIFIMYGATEASARLSYLDPRDLPRRIGSIGKAIPNVELVVRREDGSPTDVDEVGEIVARGSNIMSGYWNDPEETSQVLDEHGYHTGDLARRDAEGYLYVVGRKKDMIKVGAHRISAREIEEVILAYPAVHETAVIGVPDELLGEVIVAYVVLRDATVDPSPGDLETLRVHLKQHLPAYKLPARIEQRASLPKNPAGKLMKQELREEAVGSFACSPECVARERAEDES
ncbi:MAG: acyl--CoA ligase [Acidobacteriota bacterium]|nr:MAG: acyl--CoA ligase [Acidobacteriota bacterium]